MITGVQIHEFKILKEIDIPIRERFTVFVGPNGSGKSTLLTAIQAATDENRPTHLEDFWGSVRVEEPNTFGTGVFHHRTPARSGTVVVEELNTFESFPDIREGIRVGWRSGLGGRLRIIESYSSGEKLSDRNHEQITRHLRTRMLRLVAQSIAKTSWSESETPVVGDDGSNLPSVIAYYLKRKQPEIVDRITESLRMLVPQIRGIWVNNAPLENGKPFGEGLMYDTVSIDGLSAREMSEGTLLATAILTLLHGENPPKLLLMDDLDKGLHPRAISSLVDILNKILANRPELQIFATTHSPYLLDLIPIEAVICLYVGEDGYARAKPLTDHPEYPRWKGVMTAGEFWSTMGEEWVTRDEKAVAQ